MAELLLAKSDGTLLLRLDLSKRRALCIGRSPRCDVVVPTPTVSRRHALLYRHPRGWRMVDLGSRNGLHTELGDLHAVDMDEDRWVRLGAVHFWLSGTDDPMPSPPMVDAELMIWPDRVAGPLVSIIDAEDRPVQRLELSPTQEMVLIGSHPTCDVVVDDPSIGGVHVVLYREGRRWAVAAGGDAPAEPESPGADGTARTSPPPSRRPANSPSPTEDALLIDGHRTRRRRAAASMVIRLGTHRIVLAGAIRPTEDAQAPSVAAVMEQWRQTQLSGTETGGQPVDLSRRRPVGETATESPESAISAFLGESGEDDDDDR